MKPTATMLIVMQHVAERTPATLKALTPRAHKWALTRCRRTGLLFWENNTWSVTETGRTELVKGTTS